MKRHNAIRMAIALALLGSGATARADVLTFSGSMTGLGVSGPDASCAPLPFRGTISPSTTTGTSSLGDFTYSHNICLSGATGPSEGTFIVDFGVDAFQGSLTGLASPSATPGIADILWTYTILGGTGRFLDASGVIAGIGTTDARQRPSLVSIGFNGNINAPAVPEPGTWALLLLGFGATGVLIRRRKSRERQAFAQIA